MQINLSTNTKNVNNYSKIGEKIGYSTPVSFRGADVFEKAAVKFSKELCIETANKVIKQYDNMGIPFTKDQLNQILALEDILSQLKKTDPGLKELKRLSNKYKKSFSIEDKKNLLKHEEKIHWQELETPEIGIVRNIEQMHSSGIKKDFIPAMNVTTINGLSRIVQAYNSLGLKLTPDKEHFNILKNLIENTPDDYPYASKIKTFGLSFASRVKKDNADLIKLAKYAKENTNDEGLKIHANTLINLRSEYNEMEFLNKLSSGDLKEFEKTSVVKILAEHKAEKLAEQLPAIIKDKNVSGETKLATVWAAGRCKSGENFDLLYEMANNSEAKNLEAREVALHSLVQYLRTNEGQVKETLNNVVKEKSDLSELATILLEKTEGRYYTKDKELANLTTKEKSAYKKMRDKYVQTDFKMNIQQQNILDRALAPFRKILAGLVDENKKMYIMEDTLTKVSNDKTGRRQFDENPLYCGFFTDSLTGAANLDRIFVNKKNTKEATRYNVLAHEFNHMFLSNCLSKGDDKQKLSSLYKNAVEQNKCLGSYAKLTEGEYFAQGYEAYVSVYKPHVSIIENSNFNNGTCTVRSTLKRKDPELYDFIEYCIKKYNG